MKTAYTAIIGGYDDLKEPRVLSRGWRYVCYTDDPNLRSKNWEIRVLPKEEDKIRMSRRIKILGFSNFEDMTIWVDGSIQIIGNLDRVIKEMDVDFYTMDHPYRDTVDAEARTCAILFSDQKKMIEEQVEHYKQEGFKDDVSLYADGVLVRKQSELLKKAAEAWWDEVKNYSNRDQISLPYIIWRFGLRVGRMPFCHLFGGGNPNFRRQRHLKQRQKAEATLEKLKQEDVEVKKIGTDKKVMRWHYLNFLIQKNKYQKYLEIGIQKRLNFDRIKCPYKKGVDPDAMSKADCIMTSDEFFARNKEKFDLIFIDGLHEKKQVVRDVENAIRCLNDGGTIVLHDCLPDNELMQRVPRETVAWTGDVWKAIVYLRRRTDISIHIIDADHGLGVIRKGFQDPLIIEDPTFEDYQLNKDEWFNIIKPPML